MRGEDRRWNGQHKIDAIDVDGINMDRIGTIDIDRIDKRDIIVKYRQDQSKGERKTQRDERKRRKEKYFIYLFIYLFIYEHIPIVRLFCFVI